MPHHELYRHPLYRSYHGSVCTKATVFQLITTGIVIVAPLLLAYRSQGFWLKTNTYKEQPEVRFTHRLILYAQTRLSQNDGGSPSNGGGPQGGGGTIIWSTYALLHQLAGNQLRPSSVKSMPVDANGDGKMDTLNLEVLMPLKGGESVHTVTLIVLLDVTLHTHSRYKMSGMIHHTSHAASSNLIGQPIKSLQILGDLRLVQRAPLVYHSSVNADDHEPLINESALDVREYLIDSILHRDAVRNMSTRLDAVYATQNQDPEPSSGLPEGQNALKISLHLHIPLQTIEYWTGFWELIKWAWVQYVSFLVIFIFLIDRVRHFVFSNHLVTTVPKLDPTLMDEIKKQLSAEGQELTKM